MSEKFITTWFYAGHEKDKKAVSRGFLGMRTEIEEEVSARAVNLNEFADLLTKVYTDFDKDGYEVINVMPLNMAVSDSVHGRSGGNQVFMGEVGFSITKGAMVVGKRKDSN
jgi:hypothetical protein